MIDVGLQVKKMEMARYQDIEKMTYFIYMHSFKIMNMLHLFFVILFDSDISDLYFIHDKD